MILVMNFRCFGCFCAPPFSPGFCSNIRMLRLMSVEQIGCALPSSGNELYALGLAPTANQRSWCFPGAGTKGPGFTLWLIVKIPE